MSDIENDDQWLYGDPQDTSVNGETNEHHLCSSYIVNPEEDPLVLELRKEAEKAELELIAQEAAEEERKLLQESNNHNEDENAMDETNEQFPIQQENEDNMDDSEVKADIEGGDHTGKTSDNEGNIENNQAADDDDDDSEDDDVNVFIKTGFNTPSTSTTLTSPSATSTSLNVKRSVVTTTGGTTNTTADVTTVVAGSGGSAGGSSSTSSTGVSVVNTMVTATIEKVVKPSNQNLVTQTSGKFNLDDFEQTGMINGVSATDYSVDSLEDKPWRKPGADITDYFNYGFNEDTWRAYCERQKRMRVSESGVGLAVQMSSIARGTTTSVPILNDNSKYSGNFQNLRKAGPPPGRRMTGAIDVIGGGGGAIVPASPTIPGVMVTGSGSVTPSSNSDPHKMNVIQVMTADRREYSRKPPAFPDMSVPPPTGANFEEFLHQQQQQQQQSDYGFNPEPDLFYGGGYEPTQDSQWGADHPPPRNWAPNDIKSLTPSTGPPPPSPHLPPHLMGGGLKNPPPPLPQHSGGVQPVGGGGSPLLPNSGNISPTHSSSAVVPSSRRGGGGTDSPPAERSRSGRSGRERSHRRDRSRSRSRRHKSRSRSPGSSHRSSHKKKKSSKRHEDSD